MLQYLPSRVYESTTNYCKQALIWQLLRKINISLGKLLSDLWDRGHNTLYLEEWEQRR